MTKINYYPGTTLADELTATFDFHDYIIANAKPKDGNPEIFQFSLEDAYQKLVTNETSHDLFFHAVETSINSNLLVPPEFEEFMKTKILPVVEIHLPGFHKILTGFQ